MKRFAGIVMSAMLLTALFAVPANAASFELTDSNPESGYEKVEVRNVMIKLFFNEAVSAKDTQATNKDKITLKDSDGKDVDFEIIYDSKDSQKICLLTENDLVQEEKYTVTVDGSLVSDEGNQLGENAVVDFSTKKSDTGLGYMGLMFLMIIVMMVMTFRDQKKAKEDGTAQNIAASINTNPYKLAKEKNISVEEAVKLINAEKEKARKKAEKLNKKAEKQEEPEEAEVLEEKVYKVKTRRAVKRK